MGVLAIGMPVCSKKILAAGNATGRLIEKLSTCTIELVFSIAAGIVRTGSKCRAFRGKMPLFGCNDSDDRAHPRIVHVFLGSTQKQGTMGDGIMLENADHINQAIEIGQVENCKRFRHSGGPIPVGLRLNIGCGSAERTAGLPALFRPDQMNCVADHHAASPGARQFS